jgi:type IV pilus assembly protein PilX
MTMNSQLANKQQGLALVISLIMLLLMTLLAVNSMQTTVLEEKMAGNYKNRNMAFQSAEAGLRAGEDYLRDTAALPVFDGAAPGLYQPTSSGSPRWSPSVVNWNDPLKVRAYIGSLDVSGTTQLLDELPNFIIEEMQPVLSEGASLEVGTAIENRYYRVTSQAVGGTASSVVMLQTTYKR